MICREEAIKLIKKNINDDKLIKHLLAVEAIMRALAIEIKENEDVFALTGLIHDLDFEKTKDIRESHGRIAVEILGDKISEEMRHAILAHNFERTKVGPNSKLDYALIASDAISGLIIACALILPSKRLEDVTPEFVSNRFKQKDFARNCRRERMLFCRELGVSEERFFMISLKAMQSISKELGL